MIKENEVVMRLRKEFRHTSTREERLHLVEVYKQHLHDHIEWSVLADDFKIVAAVIQEEILK